MPPKKRRASKKPPSASTSGEPTGEAQTGEEGTVATSGGTNLDLQVDTHRRPSSKRKRAEAALSSPESNPALPVAEVQGIGTSSQAKSRSPTRGVSEHDIQSEIDRLLQASISTNTKLSYQTGLASFHKFRSTFDLDDIWPPLPSHVIQYIAYLSRLGYSSSTARSYVSAISFNCKIQNCNDVTRNFMVTKLLEGMRRLNKSADSRLPITHTLLDRILHMLHSVCFNRYETLLFKAAYSLAFFAFLRVGEICLTVGNDSNSILKISDIKFDQDEANLLLVIKQSKTDQTGKGVTICVEEVGGNICPIRCLREFLSIRPKVKGALFCHFGGEPLTRSQFSSVLGKVLKVCKVEGNYKSHSFRIGAATAAFELGCSEDSIMEAGRWKSQVYKSYIRSPLAGLRRK